MKRLRYFQGDAGVFREIWAGKIWTARPMIVVQDTPELVALHMPLNMHWKRHQSLHGDHITSKERMNKEWTLQDVLWEPSYSHLRLTIPGESYSVLLFLNSNDSLRFWYINLEDPEAPMHRTSIGFDCTDQILDMIVEPNLKDWHWEDEDELQEAIEFGLISLEQSKTLYLKGEEVRYLITSGRSIFNGWEKWRPDPAWKTPVLPEGWDIV